MEDSRKFNRFFTLLKAQFFTDREIGRQKCTVFSVSHKGIGIRFHTCEKINLGSTIFLKIYIDDRLEPLNVNGTLVWIEEMEKDYIGGIALSK